MISVVTPAHDNPEELKKFLETVNASNCLKDDFEVIVVDDFSKEDIKSVTDRFNGVKYIRLNEHAGPAKARNAGAWQARGDHVIFFDSDVALKPDTLSRFDEHFSRGESAVVGEYDFNSLTGGFFPRFKALLTESWIPDSRYLTIFVLRAAGIRKDIFVKMGGFDEDIKTASVEDYEFGDKLKKAGIAITYDPRIVVLHHHPSFKKQMKLFFLRSRDWVDIFIRRGGKFDNMCATRTEGVSSVSGSALIFFSMLGLIFKQDMFLSLALLMSAIYLVSNIKFLSIVYKRRGILFMPVALLVKLPLAVAITLGFTAGVVRAIYNAGKAERKRP